MPRPRRSSIRATGFARSHPLARLAALAMLALLSACSSTGNDAGAPIAVATSPRPAGGTAAGSPDGSTAPGSAPSIGAPATAPAPAAPAPLTWRACGTSLQCSTLTVPLDYAQPDGATIGLGIARRPSTDPNRRIGSLVVNPGGPGASGIDFIRSGLDDQLAERFDIVSWDPRGVGRSAAVDCDQDVDPYRALDWSPDDATERQQLDQGAETIARDCQSSAGDRLAHLGTEDTARDLDQLRQALGDAGLSYFGFSYGTQIGERYAALFPGKVRAMVLDGVVDPTEDLAGSLAGQTRALDKQVNEVFASCASAATPCPVADPAATYDRIAAAVEQHPLGSGSTALGPTALAYAGISASYEASERNVFLRGLAAADQGDGSILVSLADEYFGSGSYSSYAAITCVDQHHPVGGTDFDRLAADLAAISPRFGAAIANELRSCAYWPVPATGVATPVRADGAAPILVLGNTGDVATPYASAQKVAAGLANGVLLTYDGAGHTSFGKSDCVDRAVRAYLIDLAVPVGQPRCG